MFFLPVVLELLRRQRMNSDSSYSEASASESEAEIEETQEEQPQPPAPRSVILKMDICEIAAIKYAYAEKSRHGKTTIIVVAQNQIPKLVDQAAKVVGKQCEPHDIVRCQPPLDEALYRKVLANATPKTMTQIIFLKTMCNLEGKDIHHEAMDLLKQKKVISVTQVGFVLFARFKNNNSETTNNDSDCDSVQIEFAKRQITSVRCNTCVKNHGCVHAYAALAFRIYLPELVKIYPPITDMLSTMSRNDLQRLLQLVLSDDSKSSIHVFLQHIGQVGNSTYAEENGLIHDPSVSFKGTKIQLYKSVLMKYRSELEGIMKSSYFKDYNFENRQILTKHLKEAIQLCRCLSDSPLPLPLRYISDVGDLALTSVSRHADVTGKDLDDMTSASFKFLKDFMTFAACVFPQRYNSISVETIDIEKWKDSILDCCNSFTHGLMEAASDDARLSAPSMRCVSNSEMPRIFPLYKENIQQTFGFTNTQIEYIETNYMSEVVASLFVPPPPIAYDELVTDSDIRPEESPYYEPLPVMMLRANANEHAKFSDKLTEQAIVEKIRFVEKLIMKLGKLAVKYSILSTFCKTPHFKDHIFTGEKDRNSMAFIRFIQKAVDDFSSNLYDVRVTFDEESNVTSFHRTPVDPVTKLLRARDWANAAGKRKYSKMSVRLNELIKRPRIIALDKSLEVHEQVGNVDKHESDLVDEQAADVSDTQACELVYKQAGDVVDKHVEDIHKHKWSYKLADKETSATFYTRAGGAIKLNENRARNVGNLACDVDKRSSNMDDKPACDVVDKQGNKVVDKLAYDVDKQANKVVDKLAYDVVEKQASEVIDTRTSNVDDTRGRDVFDTETSEANIQSEPFQTMLPDGPVDDSMTRERLCYCLLYWIEKRHKLLTDFDHVTSWDYSYYDGTQISTECIVDGIEFLALELSRFRLTKDSYNSKEHEHLSYLEHYAFGHMESYAHYYPFAWYMYLHAWDKLGLEHYGDHFPTVLGNCLFSNNLYSEIAEDEDYSVLKSLVCKFLVQEVEAKFLIKDPKSYFARPVMSCDDHTQPLTRAHSSLIILYLQETDNGYLLMFENVIDILLHADLQKYGGILYNIMSRLSKDQYSKSLLDSNDNRGHKLLLRIALQLNSVYNHSSRKLSANIKELCELLGNKCLPILEECSKDPAWTVALIKRSFNIKLSNTKD